MYDLYKRNKLYELDYILIKMPTFDLVLCIGWPEISLVIVLKHGFLQSWENGEQNK